VLFRSGEGEGRGSFSRRWKGRACLPGARNNLKPAGTSRESSRWRENESVWHVCHECHRLKGSGTRQKGGGGGGPLCRTGLLSCQIFFGTLKETARHRNPRAAPAKKIPFPTAGNVGVTRMAMANGGAAVNFLQYQQRDPSIRLRCRFHLNASPARPASVN